MGHDVKDTGLGRRDGLLVLLVAAAAYGALTAARGTTPLAAGAGALIFVPLFSWLVSRVPARRQEEVAVKSMLGAGCRPSASTVS